VIHGSTVSFFLLPQFIIHYALWKAWEPKPFQLLILIAAGLYFAADLLEFCCCPFSAVVLQAE
jgi:hypothetical protein